MTPAPPPFSPLIFGTMAIVFMASLATFCVLIRRWSWRGRDAKLMEWAREQGFRAGGGSRWPMLPADVPIVPPADHEQLSNGRVTLLRFAANLPAGASVFHLLVRTIETSWPAAGLRPTSAGTGRSVLDLYALPPYPVYTGGERFVAVGAEPSPTKRLAASPVRGLMPADVGLLLSGHDFVLDFSSRPFDGIEFGRMIALAEQVMAHLPAGA